jgi:histone acetyltransferase (RNA polymerase elongator complex component)
LEQKLKEVPQIVALSTDKSNYVESENCQSEEFKRTSQSRFDKYIEMTTRLTKLRTARNLANSVTLVTVSGKTITMDEAISMKALLTVQKAALDIFKKQISNADAVVAKINNEIKSAVDKNINLAIQASAPLTEDHIKVLETMYRGQAGKTPIIGEAVKTGMKNLEKHIESFTSEIDYVLSEANASTKVEIK